MKKKRLREVFTKTSADILKACYKNVQRMGGTPSKETIEAEVEKQPVYKAMNYEERSDIETFLASLPSGPLEQTNFNATVDRNMSASVSSMPGGPPQPLSHLRSVESIESYIRRLPDSYLRILGASSRDFEPSQVGRGQVGGAHSATSLAGMTHGMGPLIRTVTHGLKRLGTPAEMSIGQTYRPQMDPKRVHTKRAFSDVKVPTGDVNSFWAKPKYVQETSNLYDVYMGELVPEQVFNKRNRVYGDLFNRGILPSTAEMQRIRSTKMRNESLIRKFIFEILSS